MSLFDKIKKNKIVQQKQRLSKIHLDINGDVNSTYYLGLNKHLNEYLNPYVWKYAQLDIVYNLVYNYNVFIVIEDVEYSSIYADYIDYTNSKKYRISKYDYSVCEEGEILLAYLPKMNIDVIIDMIEGTSLWDYNGIVKIYAYTKEVPEEYFKEIIKCNYNDNNFILRVQPTGDCEGLEVMINERILSSNSLKSVVKETLDKYSLDLITE